MISWAEWVLACSYTQAYMAATVAKLKPQAKKVVKKAVKKPAVKKAAKPKAVVKKALPKKKPVVAKTVSYTHLTLPTKRIV